MVLFKYKFRAKFKHSFCVMMIGASNDIKIQELEFRRLFGMPFNEGTGRNILYGLSKLIEILDKVIFSAGSLLYRLERRLIIFSKRVERSAKELIKEVNKDNRKYEKESRSMESMSRELKKNKEKLPRKIKIKFQKEKEILGINEKRKKEIVSLSHKISSFIQEIDGMIHRMHLAAKAQRREVFNKYMLEEGIIIRSNYRLGELIGRIAIEVGQLVDRIRDKIKRLRSALKRNKPLKNRDINNLIVYSRKETMDLKRVFLYAIQVSRRVGDKLDEAYKMMLNNPTESRALLQQYNMVRERLNKLREDIQTQYRRLDNEFKKGGFMPSAQIQREIRAAA